MTRTYERWTVSELSARIAVVREKIAHYERFEETEITKELLAELREELEQLAEEFRLKGGVME